MQAPYIGEDGRYTLLRELDAMFRRMAADSSGSSASISQDTLRLLPIILRASIQFISELQTNNSQLHMGSARLQATQENLQARARDAEARISSLQGENEFLKDAKRKLEFKIEDLRRNIREVEQSYASIKSQKDSLKAELEGFKLGATVSDMESTSNKRSRQE